MNNLFDFAEAAKEFQKHLNDIERGDGSNAWFKVDPKTLQLKWTDIEVRKQRHVIPSMNNQQQTVVSTKPADDTT